MITLHLARADNGVIGADGKIPWHIPGEQRRFKAMTMGKPMIMGRKTFESFPKPLPGRRHIVLTRDPDWSAAGAEVAHDPDSALALCGGPASVIGGAQVYALFLRPGRLHRTDRSACVALGDAIVPAFAGWRETARTDFAANGVTPGYSFVTLAPL
ncbi:MAG: dihydrofolate reductase [Sphingobium sp.]|nr:dihydrofolate reductase [Sphingobium sp.]